ncbi:MAG: hypothetical protein KKF20_04295 [Bacteroidetes bacterium]|nr:hypothetical protein [Bacteroidota bacterium]MBU1422334.1 hypothetical protein [Bacteroidota bacterium]MBU2471607.1 hypothetical protein [Bacteroidota bacterium]MBU2635823.1 hypothetical protein [Bacteroidota bacterium]
MLDVIFTIGIIIVLLIFIELFALPDWIGRKLRGDLGRNIVREKIKSLEDRVTELEKKVSDK